MSKNILQIPPRETWDNQKMLAGVIVVGAGLLMANLVVVAVGVLILSMGIGLVKL